MVDAAELIDAQRLITELRVLLAMSKAMLSEVEAAAVLGISADDRPARFGVIAGASPLTMLAARQAVLGMDLASRRLGGGGVITPLKTTDRDERGLWLAKGGVH